MQDDNASMTNADVDVWEFKDALGGKLMSFESDKALAEYLNEFDDLGQSSMRLTANRKGFSDISTAWSDAAKWLESYKRHHPVSSTEITELQHRLRSKRIMINGIECTARQVWEKFYRTQIETLIDLGDDSYMAALILIVPCMDRVYTLINPECDPFERERPNTHYGAKMLRMFFLADGFDEETYEALNKCLRNGVIHDAFVRGNLGIDNHTTSIEGYSDSTNVFFVQNSRNRQVILIRLPWFWERVKSRINNFYEHEQWIPGWSMGKAFEFGSRSQTTE